MQNQKYSKLPFALFACVSVWNAWSGHAHAEEQENGNPTANPAGAVAPDCNPVATAPIPAPLDATTDAPVAPNNDAAPAEQAAPAEEGWGVADGADAAGWGGFAVDSKVFDARFYGYLNTSFEQVGQVPSGVDSNGNTSYTLDPYELDVLNAHAMVQGSIYGRYRFFINLAANGVGSNTDDEPLAIRNAWVEAPIIDQYLNVRVGKLYRRFGLYNEILDAVPTFIGIEAPELFDGDHLLLTRTTSAMLFGQAVLGDTVVNYAATTGNDERINGAIPLGLDVNADIGSWLRVGTSFYTSGGDAGPSRAVGEGSPKGGVADWMERDQYYVFGGYAQLNWQGLIAQGEYWVGNHDAVRDPEQVKKLADAGLNEFQRRRFFNNGDPEQGVAPLNTKYSVQTGYVRVGYEIPLWERASVIPYGQFDYYENPEVINTKGFGGDAEAGLADDNRFTKWTLGGVFRPVPEVALKVDSSAHVLNFNGKLDYYPEVRVSFSYLWDLGL